MGLKAGIPMPRMINAMAYGNAVEERTGGGGLEPKTMAHINISFFHFFPP